MILSNRVGEDQYAGISVVVQGTYNPVRDRDGNSFGDC